jgi:DNA polymerase-1
MSMSQPALQNVPRGGDVRGCLIADPGDVLVSADYAQIEFRVAAVVTGDDVLRRAILDGADIHADVAASLFGPGFTAEQRNLAKRAGFGRMYGGGVNALVQQTGADETLARAAIAAFDATYPGVARFARKVARVVDQGQTTITTITGRPVPTEPGRGYAAINYLVQSPARDLFADGLRRLHAAGLGDRIRLVVHDEVILSVPQAEAQRYADAVVRCLETTLDGVPITAEANVLGQRWRKG